MMIIFNNNGLLEGSLLINLLATAFTAAFCTVTKNIIKTLKFNGSELTI